MKVAASAAALSVAADTTLATPASADQYDFISALDNQGVSYDNILDMIDIGKAICHTIRNGGALSSVNSALASSGWYSSNERGIIIASAANGMCPDIWPALRAQVQPPPSQAPAPAVSD
jgi:uncharacterized protein DUF732